MTRIEAFIGGEFGGEYGGPEDAVDAYINRFDHRPPLIRLVMAANVSGIRNYLVIVASMDVETARALAEKLGGLLDRHDRDALSDDDDWNAADDE